MIFRLTLQKTIKMENLLLVVYIIGIIYFAMGWFFKLRPTKKINRNVGYRTKRSRSSQKSWDFAQRYSAIAFQWAGLGLIGLGLIAPYLPGLGEEDLALPFIGLFILLVIAPILGTEVALRKRF